MIEQSYFKRRKLNKEKLSAFGFENYEGLYVYSTHILDGQFAMHVTIPPNETVNAVITDVVSGFEYSLHNDQTACGTFVGAVRSAYESVLNNIAENCFDDEVFKSAYAKEIIEYVRKTYGDELEYLWQKSPDNAVFRRKDTAKWYGAILTVSKRKLGFAADEKIEIIDLRISPNEIKSIVDSKKYFPGYHMNKSNWITVCLDGSINLNEIFQRIDNSYILAKKSK